MNTQTIGNGDLIASKTGVLYKVLSAGENAPLFVMPIGKGPIRDLPKTYRFIAAADDPNRADIIREYRANKTLPN
jgi:hypothetical protein